MTKNDTNFNMIESMDGPNRNVLVPYTNNIYCFFFFSEFNANILKVIKEHPWIFVLIIMLKKLSFVKYDLITEYYSTLFSSALKTM